MLGVGSVGGFFVCVSFICDPGFFPHADPIVHYSGNIDLPRYLPFLGSTQLGALSAIAALFLLGTHAVTAGLVKEKVLVGGDTR